MLVEQVFDALRPFVVAAIVSGLGHHAVDDLTPESPRLALLCPPEHYTVTRGDTPSGVAARFTISQSELELLNPNLQLEKRRAGHPVLLRAGQVLRVLAPGRGACSEPQW
jgi:hypothetical protein